MKQNLSRSFGAAVLALGMVMVSVQPAQAAPTNNTTAASKAADYIAANITELTSLSPSALGQALDGYVALQAVKHNGGGLSSASSIGLAALETQIVSTPANAMSYCKLSSPPASRNVGGCAKVAIALQSAGKPASSVAPYLAAVRTAPNFNQYATNQALAIIALARAGENVPTALYNTALNWSTNNAGYFPDTDTVGLMLTALSYVNDSSAAKSTAIANLKSRLAAQKVPSSPGWGLTYTPAAGAPTVANVNSTAWAAPGAHRTGDAPLRATAEAAQAVFTSYQKSDGSITPGTPGWNAMMSTTQSVPPLLGLRSYDNAGTASTAASVVGVSTSTGVTMSVKGSDTTVGTATTPVVVLGNVTTGTVSAQVLGGPGLISGSGGFTYCEPGMSGTFSPIAGKTASGAVASNTVTYSTSASLSPAGCYKWQVTLTVGGSTYVQTTEPFAVRP